MSKLETFGNIIREDLTNYSGASNLKFNEKIKELQAEMKVGFSEYKF